MNESLSLDNLSESKSYTTMSLEKAKILGRLRIRGILEDMKEERTQRRFYEFAKKSEEEGECTDEVLGEENKSEEFIPTSMEEVQRLSREKIANFGRDCREYKRIEAEEIRFLAEKEKRAKKIG